MPEPPEGITHAWYKFYLLLRPDVKDPKGRRAALIERLVQRGIPCGTGSCPDMSLELALKSLDCRRDASLPNAHALGERTIMLLVDHTLDESDMAVMADALWECAR